MGREAKTGIWHGCIGGGVESKLRDTGGGRLCDKANKFGLDPLSSRHGDSRKEFL